MDLSDPETWKRGFRIAFVEAPHIVFPLLGIAAATAWKARGHILLERLETAHERLAFERERVVDALEKNGELRATVEDLTRALDAGSVPQIAAATQAVQGAVRASEAADKAVVEAVGTAAGIGASIAVGAEVVRKG